MNRRRIGIFNLEMNQRGGGEKRSLVLADHWSRQHDVTMITDQAVDVAGMADYFAVDLGRVEFLALRDAIRPNLTPSEQAIARWETMDRLGLDLFVNQSYGSAVLCPGRRGIYMCMFPTPLTGEALPDLYARPGWSVNAPVVDPISTYDVVTANSAFTATNIERLWGRTALVVYSPCGAVSTRAKRQLILIVGRLHPMKKHDVLIDAFGRAEALHAAGWELHIAGSTSPGPEGTRWVDQLTGRRLTLPVVIHADLPRPELERLYGEASVYWHATGFGHNARTSPQLFEHFGQTTVEAMSASAAVCAINAGGQAELIDNGVTGFLWDDIDMLIDQTLALVSNDELRRDIAARGQQSSHRFSREAFCAKMDGLLHDLR